MKKGWYPDPKNPESYRWWNGESWTEDTREADQSRENLEEEGAEIELQESAHEALEKRKEALRIAGKRSSQAEPRRRRRRKEGAPKDKEDTSFKEEEARRPRESATETPAPTFTPGERQADPPSPPDRPDFKDLSSFPDIENEKEVNPFPDIFNENKNTEDTHSVENRKEKPSREMPQKNQRKPQAKKRPRPKKGKPPTPSGKKKATGAGKKILLFGAREAVHIKKLIQNGFQKEKTSPREEAPTKPLAWKRLLFWGGPAVGIILIAGALVFLPGEGEPEGERAVTTLEESAERSPKELESRSIIRCLRSTPAVRSAILEENDSGERVWKVIFVDKNYELVTITEKASPAKARLEAKLSATSFVAASGGRFSILGPLRGLEGSGLQTSPRLLKYIGSLKVCLGKIR